jgi:excisionase family DNA binding protein
MQAAKLFSPREAAQVLGISYPTLKQWIYKGKIRTVKTAGGHHRVPEQQIDKFLYRASETGDVRERRNNFRKVSGRNQLIGRVTDIKTQGLMAQVTLSIGGQRITSIITADAVRDRGNDPSGISSLLPVGRRRMAILRIQLLRSIILC